MIACRPVEWPTEPPFSEHEPTPVYPGSITSKCNDCSIDIWIGPKQQAFLEQDPEHPVYCFRCASKHALPEAFVMDLGNSHKRE